MPNKSENPLIVQSDHTVLVEVDSPRNRAKLIKRLREAGVFVG